MPSNMAAAGKTCAACCRQLALQGMMQTQAVECHIMMQHMEVDDPLDKAPHESETRSR